MDLSDVGKRPLYLGEKEAIKRMLKAKPCPYCKNGKLVMVSSLESTSCTRQNWMMVYGTDESYREYDISLHVECPKCKSRGRGSTRRYDTAIEYWNDEINGVRRNVLIRSYEENLA